jgi:hypothetical protein
MPDPNPVEYARQLASRVPARDKQKASGRSGSHHRLTWQSLYILLVVILLGGCASPPERA